MASGIQDLDRSIDAAAERLKRVVRPILKDSPEFHGRLDIGVIVQHGIPQVSELSVKETAKVK
jgi:hypothetical protein